MAGHWNALILAAGRGPDDPMAKAYGVANKCAIPVAGVPMLARVAGALAQSGIVDRTVIAIEDRAIATGLLGDDAITIAASASAPSSVIAAIEQGAVAFPLLVTTGDHALLTPEMVRHFCRETASVTADFTVGLASAEVILATWPQSVRTFFRFADVRVSGCNLFALKNDKGLKLLARWHYLEQVRKKPWRLVAAFGMAPLIRFMTGTLSLAGALATISRKMSVAVGVVMLPFAEAAIDVDKPADKDLAEEILARRHSVQSVGPEC